MRGTPHRPGGAARAGALSNLALGLVTLREARRLARAPGVRPAWARTFGWLGAGAVAGALHHGGRGPRPSWGTVGWLLGMGLAGLLEASAEEAGARHPGAARALGRAGPAVYGALLGTGRRGLDALVRAQGPAMAASVGVWVRAARAGDPRARLVLRAMAASAGAAAVRRLVPERVGGRRVDRDTLYHLAQIPGVLLLSRAVRDAR